MNNTNLIATMHSLAGIVSQAFIDEVVVALEAAQPDEDVKQIIYALERQIAALDSQATTLARAGDYSAEFPAEDARHLRAAIALLTHPAQPAGETEAWLFKCKKPGTSMTYASVDEDDNQHYPIDQWKTIEKKPLYTHPAPQVPEPWHDDKPDEWSPSIDAAHPMKSGAHDAYATAMKMVGNRKSKGALVELVCWLLQSRAPQVPIKDELAVMRDNLGRMAEALQPHTQAMYDEAVFTGHMNRLGDDLPQCVTTLAEANKHYYFLRGYLSKWRPSQVPMTDAEIDADLARAPDDDDSRLNWLRSLYRRAEAHHKIGKP